MLSDMNDFNFAGSKDKVMLQELTTMSIKELLMVVCV